MFAWQAYERGADVHLEADPTKLALLSKEFKVKKEDYEKGQKDGILEKVPTAYSLACSSSLYLSRYNILLYIIFLLYLF